MGEGEEEPTEYWNKETLTPEERLKMLQEEHQQIKSSVQSATPSKE